MTHQRRLGLVLVAATLTLAPQGARAQALGMSGHAGSLGLGVDVAVTFGPHLGVRGQAHVQPWDPERTFDEVAVTVGFASPVFGGLVDLFPTGGGLRLTGGAIYFGEHISVLGAPTAAVEVNGQMYAPDAVGSVTGVIQTRQLAPYLGIGWGNVANAGALGLVIDLGVAFQGSPTLDVTVDGVLASDPTFQLDLDQEIAEIESDMKPFRYYPVISIGLAMSLW